MTEATKDNSASERVTDLGGRGQADSTDKPYKNVDDKTPPAHEDSALESIGKAVTAPVRDAADEDSDEEPGKS